MFVKDKQAEKQTNVSSELGNEHSPFSPFSTSSCSVVGRALSAGWDRVSGPEPERAEQEGEQTWVPKEQKDGSEGESDQLDCTKKKGNVSDKVK